MKLDELLKEFISHELNHQLTHFLERSSTHLDRNILPNNSALEQILFFNTFKSLCAQEQIVSSQAIMDCGFRVFSQNNEDGILLAIFSVIGMGNKTLVEIGANCFGSDIGNPEASGVNLVVNHNWHGVFIEGQQNFCEQLTYFFARHATTKHFHLPFNNEHIYYSPVIVYDFVSESNVLNILNKYNVANEIDLLSIDIDGGDIHVAEAILEKVRPRVLIVEFEKRFGFSHSVYQPKRDDFNRIFGQSGTASLNAWHKMLSKFNYSLIALNSTCFNAFFILDDENKGRIETISPKQAFESIHIFKSVPSDFWLEPDSSWEKY